MLWLAGTEVKVKLTHSTIPLKVFSHWLSGSVLYLDRVTILTSRPRGPCPSGCYSSRIVDVGVEVILLLFNK